MKKEAISCVLILALIFSTVFSNAAVVFANPVDLEVAATELQGEGTEANPYKINNVEELILFRDSVNKGETKYNAEGVYVALGADIDMADVDWSVNIGDDCSATFDGIFDGKGYTIKNLNSKETAAKGDGYICTGLFGAIYGSAVVKNFTIENASIDTGDFVGNNAGAVVGFAYNATGSVENVKVTGVDIDAKNVTGTGAIVGYSYGGNLIVKDCTVENGVITGAAYVGGVIGYAGGKSVVEDCTVQDVDVNATSCAAGGVAGIMLDGGSATGNTVENLDLVSAKEFWKNSAGIEVGCIINSITVAGTTYKNVTANGAETDVIVG
ncbi:MAG: hypothetical protein IKU69_01675, partial [Roseburia sp.]|nr:hypothetical protein [Roseburia sp.]